MTVALKPFGTDRNRLFLDLTFRIYLNNPIVHTVSWFITLYTFKNDFHSYTSATNSFKAFIKSHTLRK